jgi:hypothetical protein
MTVAGMGVYTPQDLLLEGDTELATFRSISTEIILSIERASQIVVNVSDPKRRLLRSPAVQRSSLLLVDGLPFRYVGMTKSGPDLGLTFIDAGAVAMRDLGGRDPIRSMPAGTGTRGQFLEQLAGEVPWEAINVYTGGDQVNNALSSADEPPAGPGGASPGAVDITNLAGVDLVVAAARAAEFNGDRFTGEELVEAVAVSLAENVTSDPRAVGRNNDGSTDTGLWQINSIHPYDRARITDPVYNAMWALRIKRERDRRNGGRGWEAFYAHTPKGAAYGSGTRYKAALPIARAAVARATGDPAVGDADPTQGVEVGTTADPDENLWTATGRIAEEVQWRRFAAAGQFYAGPEFWLASLAPPVTIREWRDGVDSIDFDSTVGVETEGPPSTSTSTCGPSGPAEPSTSKTSAWAPASGSLAR